MSKSVENMTKKLAPCPFCGSRDLRVERFPILNDASRFNVYCKKCGMYGPSLTSIYCNFEVLLPDLTKVWNSRATTAPKHRPAEVVTGKDRRNIGDALFWGNIHVEHVLPLHAAPEEQVLFGGWEALTERLEDMDDDQIKTIFGDRGHALVAEAQGYGDSGSWLCSFRQIGGWVILGTYATVGEIKLDEDGTFTSCSVYCGIERVFSVWGTTYKQAIAKAINAQRRYFDGEVAKAREAAGHGRA